MMWQKATMKKILKVLFCLTKRGGMAEPASCKLKIWVRIRVMVLLEGGQGDVRGA